MCIRDSPTANPYLVLALCLAAGLDGIKNKIEVPESVDCNIYEMTPGERLSLIHMLATC